ncbi:unnamed protein product [Heterosigma akashiwo]
MNEQDKPFRCEVDGCGYASKQKHHLKQHLANIHDIDVTYYTCEIENCTYRAKQKHHLKQHLADIHDIGVTYYTCEFENCTYRAKQKSSLKRHLADIHDINVTYYTCEFENCTYRAKQKSSLKRHLADIHDINVTYYTCEFENCTYRTKQKSSLKQHLADIHDIDVTYYTCEFENCTYRTKQKTALKRHLADIHDIGTIWHTCPDNICSYKAKRKDSITRHYNCTHTPRAAQIHKRKEHEIELLLLEHGINHKREHSITYNCINDITDNHYSRIDFIIDHCDTNGKTGIIMLEVDEFQHTYSNYSVSCDISRMTQIHESIMLEGNTLPIVFIRFNPDSYKVNNITVKETKQMKQAKLIETITNIEFGPDGTLSVIYINYDVTNDTLSIFNDIEFDINFKQICTYIT